jgi:hypothetical protein
MKISDEGLDPHDAVDALMGRKAKPGGRHASRRMP